MKSILFLLKYAVLWLLTLISFAIGLRLLPGFAGFLGLVIGAFLLPIPKWQEMLLPDRTGGQRALIAAVLFILLGIAVLKPAPADTDSLAGIRVSAASTTIPTTAPTTAPTTVPTTAPTTAPTIAPTTAAPTTAATAALTIAPTTESTTEPTTVPTTKVPTEPVNKAPAEIPTDTPAELPTESPEEAETIILLVWIPKSGSKYHSKSTCSNMKNPTQVTLEEAIAWGYTPCSRCY